jgi:hypothetical protein
MPAADVQSYLPSGFSAIGMWNRKSDKTGKKNCNYKY